MNYGLQNNYESLGFSNFLEQESSKCETVSDLFRDSYELSELFDAKLKLNEITDKDIKTYKSPANFLNKAQDLGRSKTPNRTEYGNPMISTSKSSHIATKYADYSTESTLTPNYRNGENPKHRCVGQIDIFVFPEEKYQQISKDRDVDQLRKEGKMGGKSAVERDNQEILLNTKIDSANFIGSIPIVYPRLNCTQQDDELSKARYGVGYVSDNRKKPKKLDFSKQSTLRNAVLNHYSDKATQLAESYIKSKGGEIAM